LENLRVNAHFRAEMLGMAEVIPLIKTVASIEI